MLIQLFLNILFFILWEIKTHPLPLKLLFFKVTSDLFAAKSNDRFYLFWLSIIFHKVHCSLCPGNNFLPQLLWHTILSVFSLPRWALGLNALWLFFLSASKYPDSLRMRPWTSSSSLPTSYSRWTHPALGKQVGSICCLSIANLQPSCLLTLICPTNHLIFLPDQFTSMPSIFIGIS